MKLCERDSGSVDHCNYSFRSVPAIHPNVWGSAAPASPTPASRKDSNININVALVCKSIANNHFHFLVFNGLHIITIWRLTCSSEKCGKHTRAVTTSTSPVSASIKSGCSKGKEPKYKTLLLF